MSRKVTVVVFSRFDVVECVRERGSGKNDNDIVDALFTLVHTSISFTPNTVAHAFVATLLMSYSFYILQYVNRAAGAVRSGLKEPMKSKLIAQSEFKYNASVWESGEQGAKKAVSSLSQAGK